MGKFHEGLTMPRLEILAHPVPLADLVHQATFVGLFLLQ
jgi:hypothetical protein